MDNMPHNRRWFQFRLRTLFILVAVLAVPLAWLAHERNKVRERREWLASIEKKGVLYSVSADLPTQPGWSQSLLGDDPTFDVRGVDFKLYKITDAELVPFAELPSIVDLDLANTQVSDAGLVHLAGLVQLEWLVLSDTQVTDSGLVHLTGLTKLRGLYFENTQVTDAGLVHLARMTKLEELDLGKTKTTPAGRQKLRQSMPNTDIYPKP